MRSIAAQVLEEGWRRSPNDEEVAAYLKNIVELNHGRLEDSQHADLLMPGQILLMPRLPRPHAR